MRLQLVHWPALGLSILTMSMSSHIGCASQARLSGISRPSLTLFVPESGGTAVVRVFPQEKDIEVKGPCKLPAPDARATLNGLSLTRMRGRHVGDDMAYDRDCIVEFAAPIDLVPKAGVGASLKISDDSATWTFEVPTAFAARSITLVAPEHGIMRRSERVLVRWSPSSDRIDAAGIAFELYRVDAEPGTGTRIRDIDVRGNEPAFTVPPSVGDPAWKGPAWLRFLGPFHVKPALGACPVSSCSVTLGFDVPSVAVTVEN